ncbi:BPTI/Kunitz domain-containing protein [Alcanivorax sp. 1008]|uniref:BPTI/Kunitz domain-containing protein n=1 Tax=Alcanivorax sp. 1008 TaxID=2816853 RepID=UPI001D354D9D|nr:BPTI/Kunitz domain-containing protein [Alcanivorax sp. 1008]MCC1496930.1 BPTI/Kunitz domain-containing protein [Alcanivorax sp. 1008]
MRYAFFAAALLALAGCQTSEERLPEQCQLKPESGRCRAAIERYWFDPQSGTCKAFIWGGCDGTVPFETMQDCQQTCDAAAEESETQIRRLRPGSY